MRSGTDGCLIHRSLSARRPAQASPRLAPGTHALIHPRETLERSRAIVDLLIRDELIPAPRSSLNVPIGATRRIATVHIELQDLQAVRAALGGTVNDVVVCATTGALRELLLARGEDPPRPGLRAMVPENLRPEGNHGGLGNRVSTLFVELPVAEADPLRRYQLVCAAVQSRKSGGQTPAASAVTGLTELAPPVLHASLARSLYANDCSTSRSATSPPRPVACTRSARRWSISCQSSRSRLSTRSRSPSSPTPEE